MKKFKLEQRVWIHQTVNDPRVPGVIKAFAKNPPQSGSFDHYEVAIDGTAHTLTFSEPELTARGVVERIGGLAKVRQQMAEDELVADQAAHESYDGCLGVPDDELTPVQLQQKYDKASDWDDHPLFPMAQWRQEVSDCRTRVGYWEWVSYCLNE